MEYIENEIQWSDKPDGWCELKISENHKFLIWKYQTEYITYSLSFFIEGKLKTTIKKHHNKDFLKELGLLYHKYNIHNTHKI